MNPQATVEIEALLPCPFCAASMELEQFVDWEDQPLPNKHLIHERPSKCPLVAVQVVATPENIAAWNRRATSPTPAAEGIVERLRYVVGNPSAWQEGYDSSISNLISEAASTISSLTAERDAAVEAEDEAKDSFWAIYPDWCQLKGHGISTEAARTTLITRAETAEAALATARDDALEEAAKAAEAEETLMFDDKMGRELSNVRKAHARSISTAIRSLKGVSTP